MSHKIGRTSFVAVLTNGGKWWHMLASADGFGGMGGAGLCFAECRSLSNPIHDFITPCSPHRGQRMQSLRAFRRTNPECLSIRALVRWCLGCCGLHGSPRSGSQEVCSLQLATRQFRGLLKGLKQVPWMPSWLPEGFARAKSSQRWAKMAPRWAHHGSRICFAASCQCSAHPFCSSWVVLGFPWPFLGSPRGHLEANLGLRRSAVGMRCG